MNLTNKEIEFLMSLGLNLNFEKLSDEDFVDIEELVGEKLQTSGFDKDYKPTPIGMICESILDKLP